MSYPWATRILSQGPLGTFTLHRDTLHPGVFLAGGIDDSSHSMTKILKKCLPDLMTPFFYLAAPSSKLTSMRLTLNAAGGSDDKIRT
jgi:hypothetical protein